jgi:hypothetical protein
METVFLAPLLAGQYRLHEVRVTRNKGPHVSRQWRQLRGPGQCRLQLGADNDNQIR